MSWQGVTRPAPRTTAPIDELSNGAPSTRASPLSTTRSLTPMFRGGAGGVAEVGAVFVDCVRPEPLLSEHAVAAASHAIIMTHPSRRRRLTGCERGCTGGPPATAVVTLPLLRPQ